MNDEHLGPATTTWNDYLGTAAADDAEVRLGSPSLYQLAGLDREQWRIIGVDLQVSGGDPQVVVYAVDTRRLKIDGDGHDRIHDAHGQVPVTAVRLRASTQVEEFLSRAFQRISLRLVARGFRDETITVEDTVDAAEPSAN